MEGLIFFLKQLSRIVSLILEALRAQEPDK